MSSEITTRSMLDAGEATSPLRGRESNPPTNSIAVAMSGGVDSSTAAAILQRAATRLLG